MGRRGHIGRGALNCVETLLMHSKCLRKFPRKELSLVSCIEKFAKYSFACHFVNIHDGNAIFAFMFCLLITLMPREYPQLSLTQYWPKCFVLLANCFSAS